MHPYLTSETEGIGGKIKEYPEDFLVEEIPAYPPCGSGEHCYLMIEKHGITTLEAIRRIAKLLNTQEREIGYAGMKDSVGVTQQTISIPKISPEQALGIELDGLRVLKAERHTNKLKLGHLKGNRFRIIIRGVSENSSQSVPAIVERLTTLGVPNYYGYQRYGAQENSHLIGLAILQRDWKGCIDTLIGKPDKIRDHEWSAAINAYCHGDLELALQLFPRHCRSERDVLQRLLTSPDKFEKAFATVHPRLKKLYISALQSFLFDQVVALRIKNLDKLMIGDLAFKHINGACFLVEDLEVEQKRATNFEISPSGPMFGCKMKQTEGEARQLEENILRQSEIELKNFDLPGGLRMEGERRPLRVPVSEMSWELSENVLTLVFSLPKGSYATSVVREITKTF